MLNAPEKDGELGEVINQFRQPATTTTRRASYADAVSDGFLELLLATSHLRIAWQNDIFG